LGNLPAQVGVTVSIYNAVGQLIQHNAVETDASGNYRLILKPGISGLFEVVVNTETTAYSSKLLVAQDAQ